MKFKACILISNIDCKLPHNVRNAYNTTATLKSPTQWQTLNSEICSIFKRHSEGNKSEKQIDFYNYLSSQTCWRLLKAFANNVNVFSRLFSSATLHFCFHGFAFNRQLQKTFNFFHSNHLHSNLLLSIWKLDSSPL